MTHHNKQKSRAPTCLSSNCDNKEVRRKLQPETQPTALKFKTLNSVEFGEDTTQIICFGHVRNCSESLSNWRLVFTVVDHNKTHRNLTQFSTNRLLDNGHQTYPAPLHGGKHACWTLAQSGFEPWHRHAGVVSTPRRRHQEGRQ